MVQVSLPSVFAPLRDVILNAGKSAFVVTGHLGTVGGGALAPLLLCQELVDAGIRVTAFAQSLLFGEDAPSLHFTVVTPRFRRGCRWDLPGRSLARQVSGAITRERPDYVVICGTTKLARYLLGSKVADRLLVWEFTNATPGNKLVDAKAAQLLSRCRAMLSPSATIDANIRSTYGYKGPILRLPFWIEDHGIAPADQGSEVSDQRSEVGGQTPENVAELPGGTPGSESSGQQPRAELRRPTSDVRCPTSRPDFIFLGRRDPEKGLHELVAATAIVAKSYPGVQVMITGPGSEEPFRRQAEQLGIGQNVHFAFFEGYADVLDALAGSRFLVLPSYHEGYPLVLLEAAERGVPFIATTVGSIPEVFAGSRAGILIPPKDADALAAAMAAALGEDDEAHQLRRRAARADFARLSSREAVNGYLRSMLAGVDAL
jgi:glycosyltransferase involved in cell wall biosynthesis